MMGWSFKAFLFFDQSVDQFFKGEEDVRFGFWFSKEHEDIIV